MVLFLLLVGWFKDWGATLHLCSSASSFLTFFFHLCILGIYAAHDVEKCLVIHRKYTVSMIDEHIESQHSVVWTRNHIIVIRWKHTSREPEDRRILIGQVLKNESTETWASTSSDRMEKEESLQTVAFLNCATNPFFDLVFVQRTVLVMTTCPVVASARLVTDALPWLKDIAKLTVQYLVVDYASLHIDYNCARFEIIDLRASL